MAEVIKRGVPLSKDAFCEAERLEEPVEVVRPAGNEDYPDRVKTVNARFKVTCGEGDDAVEELLTSREFWEQYRTTNGTDRRELARGGSND